MSLMARGLPLLGLLFVLAFIGHAVDVASSCPEGGSCEVSGDGNVAILQRKMGFGEEDVAEGKEDNAKATIGVAMLQRKMMTNKDSEPQMDDGSEMGPNDEDDAEGEEDDAEGEEAARPRTSLVEESGSTRRRCCRGDALKRLSAEQPHAICTHDSRRRNCDGGTKTKHRRRERHCDVTCVTPAPTPAPTPYRAPPPCDKTREEDVNDAMHKVHVLVNETWLSLAPKLNLDPWNNFWNGEFDIGCKWGGDIKCGLSATGCQRSYLRIKIHELLGLKNLYISSAPDLELFAPDAECNGLVGGGCAYKGRGKISMGGGRLDVNLESFAGMVKCKNLLSSDTKTIFNFWDLTCRISDSLTETWKIEADTDACINTCTRDYAKATFRSLKVSGLKLKGNVTCSSSEWGRLKPLGERLLKEAIALVETSLNDVIADVLKDGINDVLKDEVIGDGFPPIQC